MHSGLPQAFPAVSVFLHRNLSEVHICIIFFYLWDFEQLRETCPTSLTAAFRSAHVPRSCSLCSLLRDGFILHWKQANRKQESILRPTTSPWLLLNSPKERLVLPGVSIVLIPRSVLLRSLASGAGWDASRVLIAQEICSLLGKGWQLWLTLALKGSFCPCACSKSKVLGQFCSSRSCGSRHLLSKHSWGQTTGRDRPSRGGVTVLRAFLQQRGASLLHAAWPLRALLQLG